QLFFAPAFRDTMRTIQLREANGRPNSVEMKCSEDWSREQPVGGSSVGRTDSCDVLVIGGGPAGSTASTILKRKGWHVVLIEKDVHPRFHIGESLLPRNLPIFDELGVMEDIARIGIVKRGADFTLPDYSGHITVEFSNALDPQPPTAFQVKRAQFDH